ncbi:hypothetical protein C8R47DRAFT_574709 [Mycena vitilis]|nr:hypothetical protein C8R47DRAFT_574709 [Mycena vitilis]
MDIPGRFGTVELLRQRPASNTTTNATHQVVVVASFGVDTPTVSFGRDPACSVRLYYPDVAPLHARIVFNDDRKAFVDVLGRAGVLVDGCHVLPLDDGGEAGKRTIALGNGSELEIHGKRFRFSYPPKEMRAALAASPARPANRALRLSMIASAQVFSPRPSSDPRQNLRVLQSPLRLASRSRSPSKSPTKSNSSSSASTPTPSPRGRRKVVSPSKTALPASDSDDDDDEQGEGGDTITLVQGAHPRVVEEARDLVILEDVEVVPPPSPSPSPTGRARAGSMRVSGTPPTQSTNAARTPRRQSLHRAVLIRSAQRAVWAAHTPTSDSGNSNSNGGSAASTPGAGPASEEKGKESVVQGPLVRGWTAPRQPAPASAPQAESDTDSDSGTDEEEEEEEVRGLRLEVVSVSSGSESEGDGDDDQDRDDQEGQQQRQQTLGWRKSLERIALWPFGGRVKKEEEDTQLPPAELETQTRDDDDLQLHADDDDYDDNEQNEGERPEERNGNEDEMKTKTMQTQTTPRKKVAVTHVRSPFKSPAKAPALGGSPALSFARPASPTKTTGQTPGKSTPPPALFGSPHPAARTPPGFKRKSLPSAEVDATPAEEAEQDQTVPMDVDAEGYTPLYEDLTAYRANTDAADSSSSSSTPTSASADVGTYTQVRDEREKAKAGTPQAARIRPLAAFMTPQAPRTGVGIGRGAGAGVPRYSLGGGAQRVRVEDSPWKVRDLMAAPAAPAHGGTPARRPLLSNAERAAISERRRSAVKAPDDFFKGGVPGMSPVKKKGGVALGRVMEGEVGEGADGNGNGNAKTTEGSGEQDPRRMLENLRATVAGLKQRRESVLADAGRGALLVESDMEVEAQPSTDDASEEQEVEKEKERPKARMLRGKARKEPASESPVEEAEVETPPTKTKAAKERARTRTRWRRSPHLHRPSLSLRAADESPRLSPRAIGRRS